MASPIETQQNGNLQRFLSQLSVVQLAAELVCVLMHKVGGTVDSCRERYSNVRGPSGELQIGHFGYDERSIIHVGSSESRTSFNKPAATLYSEESLYESQRLKNDASENSLGQAKCIKYQWRPKAKKTVQNQRRA
jgi:hypothetical protein